LTAALLAPYKNKLSSVISQPITFNVQGVTVVPKPADIANWLEITPQPKSQKVDITVNSGKVAAYIDSISARFNHPPKAQIMTTASDGSQQQLVAGQSGVTVVNKAAIATALADNVLNAKGSSHKLEVSLQNFQTITTGDYPKWIEVDLTNKRMYAYEHGNLIKTQLVTAGAPKTPTVTGQFAIYSKFAQQTMRGRNADGSNYVQPDVRWINYFYQDYAIHGNYWRPLSYFGNINSSHGCVSTVNSEAKWMYDWAPIGTPVIVHK
jgi:lipoprotein-anchoring transpeptidase ErfK/SrfK